MTSAKGTPESVVRERTPIPQRPGPEDIRGIVGEIARQREDPELEILLQHMIQAIFARFDDIWDALEILDKRFQEFEDEDLFDTEFREISRQTQRRERTVTDDSGDIEIDVLDVITQEVVMKGNKTGNRYIFYWKEPLPV